MTRVPYAAVWVLGCVLILLVLSGCGSSDAYRGAIASHGAEAADDVLETNVWGVCLLPSIGSVRRRYGGSMQAAKAYAEFCNHGGAGTMELILDADSVGN